MLKPCAQALAALLQRLSERARAGLRRSIAMGESIARPQPKNGIHRSSRFTTQTCGGKISLQRDRFPGRLVIGKDDRWTAGMFSAPSTR